MPLTTALHTSHRCFPILCLRGGKTHGAYTLVKNLTANPRLPSLRHPSGCQQQGQERAGTHPGSAESCLSASLERVHSPHARPLLSEFLIPAPHLGPKTDPRGDSEAEAGTLGSEAWQEYTLPSDVSLSPLTLLRHSDWFWSLRSEY